MKKTGHVLLLLLWSITSCCTLPCFAETNEDIVSAIYISADGEKLAATFNNASSTVTITLPDGTTATLPAATSASGARYSDGKMTFWEHQGSATVDKAEKLIFEGAEATDESSADLEEGAEQENLATATPIIENPAIKEAVEKYAAVLKQSDPLYKDPVPSDHFECQLDAGEGKEPITAMCTNAPDTVRIVDQWAAVDCVLTAVEEKYKKFPVMADGILQFLLKKDKDGNWQGAYWSLGSAPPELSKKQLQDYGATEEILSSLGWMIRLEDQ